MKYDKGLYKLIKQNKKARERLYVNRTVAYVMKQKHPHVFENIPTDKMEYYVLQILKLNRQWRRIMQLEPDLRGRDYSYKKIAEQKEQIRLGYESGYYQDSETVKKIQ